MRISERIPSAVIQYVRNSSIGSTVKLAAMRILSPPEVESLTPLLIFSPSVEPSGVQCQHTGFDVPVDRATH